MMKSSKPDLFVFLTLALQCIIGGIIMISKDLVAVGVNSRTLSVSGFGGHLLILGGCIFLVVAYYTLSPFSKIRSYFEGGTKKGKNTKNKSKR
jgi:hypothetical protein